MQSTSTHVPHSRRLLPWLTCGSTVSLGHNVKVAAAARRSRNLGCDCEDGEAAFLGGGTNGLEEGEGWEEVLDLLGID
eukprot:2494768-Rhodomonas_salina.2